MNVNNPERPSPAARLRDDAAAALPQLLGCPGTVGCPLPAAGIERWCERPGLPNAAPRTAARDERVQRASVGPARRGFLLVAVRPGCRTLARPRPGQRLKETTRSSREAVASDASSGDGGWPWPSAGTPSWCCRRLMPCPARRFRTTDGGATYGQVAKRRPPTRCERCIFGTRGDLGTIVVEPSVVTRHKLGYVFRTTDGGATHAEVAKLTAADAPAGGFGWSVAIDGGTVVIGPSSTTVARPRARSTSSARPTAAPRTSAPS